MNILYMHTHDTGRYIQPYGYAVPTPHLMELAEEGTVFRKAFCVAPTCTPSRSGLLTGLYPHQNGLWGLTHRGFSLHNSHQHMASFLNKNDFETVLCGIQHEALDPKTLGYTRILGEQNYTMNEFKRDWEKFDRDNANNAAEFIRGKHEKPFFLAFGMFNTHRDYPVLPAASSDGYVMPPTPIADTPENRHDWAEFINSAKIMDDCVGEVLQALRESGQDNDTFVVFTTDHGPALPEMKQTLYDFGIGVSFIVRCANNAMSGQVCDHLLSHIDFFPTVCDMLALAPPDELEGRSFLPLLRGEPYQERECIYAENSFHVTYDPTRCLRTERYKYIRRFSSYPYGMPGNTDGSPDKAMRLKNGFYDQVQDKEKLHDLLFDPCERVNLADRADMLEIKKELAARLDEWMRQTHDPLANGTMIPPMGAKIHYPDSRSNFDTEYVTDWSKLEVGRDLCVSKS